MANSFYTSALKAFLDGDIDLLSDTIKVQAIDTSLYVFSTGHDFLDDVAVGSRVGSSQTLAGKSTTAGVFDADNISITGLVAPPTVEALVFYKDTGVEATSPLICYIDTATGIPTPSGVSIINVNWSDGANKIFKLGS